MAIQARTEFAAAINQIASEKGVDTAVILDAIEQAALAAYRKDLSYRNEPIPDDFEELTAKIDPSSGEIGIFRGDTNITPPGFARIAAQTAKQVIVQKLHEAEKGAIHDEYAQKVGTIVSGTVQRQEGNTYFVDLGRAEGVMPPGDQTRDEFYSPNQRLKFYIKEIRESGRGPEVIVSRADPGLVKGLFAMEVPEIQSSAVEIKEIAREAGARTKVAVISSQDGVDPVGSLVGQKGVRVQAVINELGEEKIDIIPYSADPARFIVSALSPAKDLTVELNEEEKVAKVKAPDDQLSLAIGKGGQNVRLAAKLTGWKIDIEGLGGGDKEEEKKESEPGSEPEAIAEGTAKTEEESVAQASEEVIEKIEENIDQAVEEESLDGAAQPEPSQEEQAKAVDDAETDMAEEDSAETKKEDDSPEKNEDQSEGIAEESEFNKVEEEKIAKEEALKETEESSQDANEETSKK
jgi:transcription termination/antitermination protein NusA